MGENIVRQEIVMESVVKFVPLAILTEKKHLLQKSHNENIRNWKCYS